MKSATHLQRNTRSVVLLFVRVNHLFIGVEEDAVNRRPCGQHGYEKWFIFTTADIHSLLADPCLLFGPTTFTICWHWHTALLSVVMQCPQHLRQSIIAQPCHVRTSRTHIYASITSSYHVAWWIYYPITNSWHRIETCTMTRYFFCGFVAATQLEIVRTSSMLMQQYCRYNTVQSKAFTLVILRSSVS